MGGGGNDRKRENVFMKTYITASEHGVSVEVEKAICLLIWWITNEDGAACSRMKLVIIQMRGGSKAKATKRAKPVEIRQFSK